MVTTGLGILYIPLNFHIFPSMSSQMYVFQLLYIPLNFHIFPSLLRFRK